MAASKLIAQDLWRSQIRRLGLECMVKISRAAFRHCVTLAPKALTAAFWPHPVTSLAKPCRVGLEFTRSTFPVCNPVYSLLVSLACWSCLFEPRNVCHCWGEDRSQSIYFPAKLLHDTYATRKTKKKTSQYYVHQELEQGGRGDHVTSESNTKRYTCFHGWKRWSGNKSTSR